MSRKVLVVDDSPAMRMIVAAHLERHPVLRPAGSAGDAAGAIETALASQPDIILLDLHLPGVDPWDLVRRMRKAAPHAVLAAFTGRDDLDELQTLFQGHIDFLLRKEDGPAAALDRLAGALDGPRKHPAAGP